MYMFCVGDRYGGSSVSSVSSHHHHHYPGVGQNHHHSSFLQHHNSDPQQCLPTVATALQQMHADKIGELNQLSQDLLREIECPSASKFTEN